MGESQEVAGLKYFPQEQFILVELQYTTYEQLHVTKLSSTINNNLILLENVQELTQMSK